MKAENGLLNHTKTGFSLEMTEEEYEARREEIFDLAKTLSLRMDVLELIEPDYRIRLAVLSMVSYFGFDWISGEALLKAANIPHNDEIGDLKHFFMYAGWTPYYLEYRFNKDSDLEFHDLAEYFYTDVELYMDLSETFEAVRVPSALRIL